MAKRICVFCGSSMGTRPSYQAAAVALAQALAARKIGIVYGGGNTGLMGVLANTAIDLGCEVIGVMPHSLVPKERANQNLTELRLVDSMHQRKAMMADLADAFIALPGGYGTFEEFCEILTWTQLGLLRKPSGILNVDGYYDHLLRLFDHAVAEEFVKPAHRAMVIAETDAAALIDQLLSYKMPMVSKFIDATET